MLSTAQLQAFSRSLNETPFLWKRRKAAHDALRGRKNLSLFLPDRLAGGDRRSVDAACALPKGVIGGAFTDFGKAGPLASESNSLRHVLGAIADDASDLSLRHAAFLSLGVYIRIPDGMTVTPPVHLHWRDRSPWAATHLALIVGKDSHVTVVERLEGGAAGVWSHTAEIVLEDGADLEFVSLQTAATDASLHIRHAVAAAAGASIAWRMATLGGHDVEHALRSTLAGDHARSSVDWIAYAKGRESQRLSARNVFAARDGGGEMTIKGVAEGKAHIRCDGMIDIGPGGRGTDTYLTEDVLMLDPTARVDAIPGLEIKTNDVKASHSATVSRVTEEDLFYFAARGISPVVARRMYIEGFLGELTGRISDPLTCDAIAAAALRKYGG